MEVNLVQQWIQKGWSWFNFWLSVSKITLLLECIKLLFQSLFCLTKYFPTLQFLVPMSRKNLSPGNGSVIGWELSYWLFSLLSSFPIKVRWTNPELSWQFIVSQEPGWKLLAWSNPGKRQKQDDRGDPIIISGFI